MLNALIGSQVRKEISNIARRMVFESPSNFAYDWTL